MSTQLPYPYDEVVIRFSRQRTETANPLYQATVRAAHLPVSGGVFHVNILNALQDFLGYFQAVMELAAHTSATEDDESPEVVASYREASSPLTQKLSGKFFALLPNTLRSDFQSILQYAYDQSRGVRLVLEASAQDSAYQLLVLPWELVFANITLGHLARSPRLIVVRHLLDTVRRAAPVTPPHHVLHAVAAPLTEPDNTEIQVLGHAERASLQAVLGQLRYTSLGPHTSIGTLDTTLSGPDPYSILHFTGHGNEALDLPYAGPTGTLDRSFLSFVGANGEPQAVSGERLRYSLNDTEIRLVVLNACHSASTLPGSVALELVYGGTPCVVALQAKISVKAAAVFSTAFYEALLLGNDPEVAVAIAREALDADFDKSLDWVLPTCYMAPGIEKPGLLERGARILWFAFGVSGRHWLMPFHLIGGSGWLLISLWLTLNEIKVVLPHPSNLAVVMGWTAILPFGIALFVYTTHIIPRMQILNVRSTDIAIRTLEATLIGFGMGAFYFGWLWLLFMVASGLWSNRYPMGQGLFIVPFVLGGTVIAYSQAFGHGNALLDRPTHAEKPDYSFLPIAFIAMLLGLYGPLYLLNVEPFWITPPVSTLLVGILWLMLAYLLRDQTR